MELEELTSSPERLVMALVLIGGDEYQNLPGSLEELRYILGGDPLSGIDGIFVPDLPTGFGDAFLNFGGDPLFGIDGIFATNLTTGLGNVYLNRIETGPVVEFDVTAVRLLADVTKDLESLLVAFEDVLPPLVTPVPLSVELEVLDVDATTGLITGFSSRSFNLLELSFTDPAALADLFTRDPLDLERNPETAPVEFGDAVEIVIGGEVLLVLPNIADRPGVSLRDLLLNEPRVESIGCQDLDVDGVCDLDVDGDGTPDFTDDYTSGPITDDSLLCAIFLLGDRFKDLWEDSIQFDFARGEIQELLVTTWLPPVPVFCPEPTRRIGAGEPGPWDVVWQSSRRSRDPDGDGVFANRDNCPYTFNPLQTDSGGVGTSVPDGRGDACQCGDVNRDGTVDFVDSILINRGTPWDLESSAPGTSGICDVTGDGLCNFVDAIMINRETSPGLVAPLFDPDACANAQPESP